MAKRKILDVDTVQGLIPEEIQLKLLRHPQSIRGELWRQIPQYPKYYVSTQGRIASVARGSIKFLSIVRTLDGDTVTYSFRPGRIAPVKVHVVMAKTFLVNVYDDSEVLFLDGNRDNLTIGNLSWATPARRKNALAKLDETSDGTHMVLQFMHGDNAQIGYTFAENYRHYKAVAAWEMYKMRNYIRFPIPQAVEDVVQESLAKACAAMHKGMFSDPANFEGWVATIVRNTAKTHVRLESMFMSATAYNSDGEGYDVTDRLQYEDYAQHVQNEQCEIHS